MFLRQRSTQRELSDSLELSFAQVASNYREIGRMNRFFLHADPFQRLLPKLLGAARCAALSLLDVGAGDGSLGRQLERWASRRGWHWRVTNLDRNPHACRLSPAGSSVTGSLLELPFPDNHFDVVIASQVTHHLGDEAEVVQHFREAWRVTREGLLLNDLHRNPVLYGLVWLSVRMAGLSAPMRNDALVSVRRAWWLKEWRELAAQAGIPDARVWLYFGSRVILQARKKFAGAPA